MKINKPKFWDKKINVFSLTLLPFSFIYIFFIVFKKFFQKENDFLFLLYVLVIFILVEQENTNMYKIKKFVNEKRETIIIKKKYKISKR